MLSLTENLMLYSLINILISFPQVKWFEQQRELRRVKRDVPIEQHVKKRDFGDGPDPVDPNLTIQSTHNFSFQSEFSDGLADDIWDGIFAEMKGESSTESQKRKRQNSFASSFSDPMFRWNISVILGIFDNCVSGNSGF